MLNHPFNVLAKHNFKERAVRDPVTLTTMLFPSLVAGTLAHFAVTTAIYLGISAITSWAISALTPKPKAPSTGLLTNLRDVAAPGEIIYGKVRKGGVITWMWAGNSENETLKMIISLAAHEVDAIESIYIDDKIVTLDGSGFVTSDPWDSKIKIEKYLGTSTQTTPPDLIGLYGVTSAFRMRGIAYLYVTMTWDEDVFINGIPNITAVIRGKKIFDPRTSTLAYSNNWALCVRDYLTNVTYGLATPTSEIDDDSFITAANVSDQNISLAAGGTEKRYTCNGVLSTGDTPKANLDKLMTAGAGTLYWGQGQWEVKAGSWTTPVKTFTYDDLRSEIQITTRVSVRDNYNVVKGTFINASSDFITVDFPEYRGSTFLTQDNGEENVLDLELPMTTSRATAQRIAKLTLFRTREQMVVSAEFSLKAFEVSVGDNINLTLSRYGWTSKPFEVMSWKLVSSDGGDARVALLLKETSSAAFDWTAEEQDIVTNDSTLPDPFSGLTITGLARTNITDKDDDGRTIKSVELTWNHSSNRFRSYYNVHWKQATATKWNQTTSRDNEILIENLKANVFYDFRVQVVTFGGAKGPFATLNALTGFDITAPAVVSTFSATAGPGRIDLAWDNPTDIDFSHVTIWENTVNNSGTATKIGRSSNESFRRTVTPGATRYYWLRSVDFTGNVSAFTTVRSATARRILNDELTDLAVSTAKMADAAVVRDKIGTNAVGIDKTQLTDRENLLPEFSFDEADSSYFGTSNTAFGGVDAGFTTASRSGGAAVWFKRTNEASDAAIFGQSWNLTSVREGMTYAYTFEYRSDTASTYVAGLRVRIRYFDINKVILGTTALGGGNLTLNPFYEIATGTWTAPTNARYATFDLFMPSTAPAGCTARVDSVTLRQQIWTEVVSDRAVTYPKLPTVAQDRILGRASAAGTGDTTALTGAQVAEIIGKSVSLGGIGTTATLRLIAPNTAVTVGSTYAGGDLIYAGFRGVSGAAANWVGSAVSPSGTWMALCNAAPVAGEVGGGTFLRIA